MKIRVLAIDDDKTVLELLKDALDPEEFIVFGASDAASGLAAIGGVHPDLVLLDWALPDTSGFQLCQRLRGDARTQSLPIIMLTAEGQIQRKLAAFEKGADDYVTKPFILPDLMARIRAVVRRSCSTLVPCRLIERGPLAIDGLRYKVTLEGKPVALGTTEFEILYLLASNEHNPMTRQVLLEHVCPETTETLRTIDAHITHLRQKLGPVAGAWIKTIRRVGYMFSSDLES